VQDGKNPVAAAEIAIDPLAAQIWGLAEGELKEIQTSPEGYTHRAETLELPISPSLILPHSFALLESPIVRDAL